MKRKQDKVFTIKIALETVITWVLAFFIAFVFVKDHLCIKDLQKKVKDLEVAQLATDELAVLNMQYFYELSERVDELTIESK